MKALEVLQAVPTIEGAGVHLKRVFGYRHQPLFDPFLLLDDFHGNSPRLYEKGFPWHPHRGIETITLLLHGTVEHGDSLGNSGVIYPGDVQWMTAGSGIIHQEMPKGEESGLMRGVQLWANLPASQKMTDPKYRDVRSADIPAASIPGGTVRVVAGRYQETLGPVDDIVIDPELFLVQLEEGGTFSHSVQEGYTFFVYVLDGEITLQSSHQIAKEHIVMLESGREVTLAAASHRTVLLAASGKPLKEPIAWGGPIVMNTQEELRRAFDEFEAGTFLRS